MPDIDNTFATLAEVLPTGPAEVTPPVAPTVSATPPVESTPAAPVISAAPVVEPQDTAPAAPAADTLDGVSLPPYAKPATTAAFDKVKELARTELSKRDARIKELEEASTQPVSVDKLPKEVADELAELRAFRESLSVEGDPVFEKKFGEPLKKLDESIFSKFREAGLGDKVIDGIKAVGLDELDYADLYSKMEAAGLDATRLKLVVEAKRIQREDLKESRDEAIKEAKNNSGKFHEERRKDSEQTEFKKLETVQTTTNSLVGRTPAFQLKEVPAGASAEQKAAIDKHNAFIGTVRNEVATFAKEMTPESYAQAIAAFGLARIFRAEAISERALTKDLSAKLSAANDRLTKLEASGRSTKPGESVTARPTPAKAADLFHTSADQAFDAHMKAAEAKA